MKNNTSRRAADQKRKFLQCVISIHFSLDKSFPIFFSTPKGFTQCSSKAILMFYINIVDGCNQTSTVLIQRISISRGSLCFLIHIGNLEKAIKLEIHIDLMIRNELLGV